MKKKFFLVFAIALLSSMNVFSDAPTVAAVNANGLMNFIQQVKTTYQLIQQVANGVEQLAALEKQIEVAYKSIKNFKPETWQDFVDYVNINTDRVDNIIARAKNLTVLNFNGKTYNPGQLLPLAADWGEEMKRLSELTPDDNEYYNAVRDIGFNENVVKIWRAVDHFQETTNQAALGIYQDASQMIKDNAAALEKITSDDSADDSTKASIDKVFAANKLMLKSLDEIYRSIALSNQQRALADEIAKNQQREEDYGRQIMFLNGAGYTNIQDFNSNLVDFNTGEEETGEN